jgi:DNA-binding CsgD family transcriptional regulator
MTLNSFDIRFFNQFQDELVDGFEHIYAHDPENIFIASENGFIHFNSLKLDAVSNEFKVILNEVWDLKRDSIIFAGSLLNSKELLNAAILPNKQNALRFSFSAPYFEQFEHVKYRYWLKGYDENWSDWSRKTEKEYTNLHAGDYEFKVQAINAYGVKSTESSFRFMITAPWYATFWAYIIYVLFFCGGVLLIYYRGQKNFKKKTEELKQQQEEAFKRKESTFKEKVEKSEAEIIQLRNEKLKAENTYKTSELASATMHLVQKGELMQKLKKDLKELLSNASKENARKINQLIRTIDQDSQLDDSWNQFELYFDQVHTNFFQRLRQNFPELTPKDQRLCAYLRMNLSTKEISPLMNISVRGVEISRYRLRKKLELNSEVNLVDFMMKI